MRRPDDVEGRVQRMAGRLAAFGAPFVAGPPGPGGTLEETLAEAVSLAHEDAQLAKVLPFVLWRNRERLDLGRLEAQAGPDEREALGLFLELAGVLGRAPSLVRAAEGLRPQGLRRPGGPQGRPFFTRATGRYALAARRRTPVVARRWGFLLNLSLASMAAVFRKHGDTKPQEAPGAALARGRGSSPVLSSLVASARAYAAEAKAPRTRTAYRKAWQAFAAWAASHQLPVLPAAPETVALYLTDRANLGRKVATLNLDLAALSQAHKAAGHDSPTTSAVVREVFKGIRRTKGVAQDEKAPADVPTLKRLLATLPDSLRGKRDRALLLVGFAGAFRRSELVSLNVGDVRTSEDGLTVRLRRSKTDPEGAGRTVGIPHGSKPATCPVRALATWTKAAGITQGALFRHVTRHGAVKARLAGEAVAEIVKRAAKDAGLDARRYAGHSLRAGLVTAAAKAGKPERVIAEQTGHKSIAQLRKYVREGGLFEENAAGGLL